MRKIIPNAKGFAITTDIADARRTVSDDAPLLLRLTSVLSNERIEKPRTDLLYTVAVLHEFL